MNQHTQNVSGASALDLAAHLSDLAATELNFEQFCQKISDIATIKLDNLFSGVFLIDEPNQIARLYSGSGSTFARMLANKFEYSLFGTVALARCYQTGEAIWSDQLDLSIREYFANASGEYCVPICYAGEIYGVFSAIWDESSSPPEAADQFMHLAANLMAMRLYHKKILVEIRDLRVQTERRTRLQLATRRIAGLLIETTDLNTLLNRSVEILCESFDLYYAGIFLVDEEHIWANLAAGYGSAGEIMLRNHHRLKIGGQSMIGTAIQMGEVQVAMDVGEEQIHFRNPYLPSTRSELAVPLRYKKLILGAITVQSRYERAFSQDDLMTLQTLADFISLSVANF
ncbi:MAG: GAF domain-containing protein [Anaerolineales bacterium]